MPALIAAPGRTEGNIAECIVQGVVGEFVLAQAIAQR
jgi:hypothetical protein